MNGEQGTSFFLDSSTSSISFSNFEVITECFQDSIDVIIHEIENVEKNIGTNNEYLYVFRGKERGNHIQGVRKEPTP